MRRSGLVVPSDEFAPVRAQRVVFKRGPIHLTEFGHDWLQGEIKNGRLKWKNGLPPLAGGSGQLSSYAEIAVLNHITGEDNAAFANLNPTYLALCTTLPTSSSTGSTIVEATYTGYARITMTSSWGSAATGTAPASISNTVAITFAACTALTSTIVGMAACTALTTGNVLYWCSCASTVISTTQTPATVAIGGLSASLT